MKRQIFHIKSKIIRLLFLSSLLFMSSVYSLAEVESNEYNIKAMFVLNFMKYVEWPTETNNDIFKIGIAGESELFNSLQNMTNSRNEKAKIIVESSAQRK